MSTTIVIPGRGQEISIREVINSGSLTLIWQTVFIFLFSYFNITLKSRGDYFIGWPPPFLLSRFHINSTQYIIQSCFLFFHPTRPLCPLLRWSESPYFEFGGPAPGRDKFKGGPTLPSFSSDYTPVAIALYFRSIRIASQKQNFETVRIVSQHFTIIYPRDPNADFL